MKKINVKILSIAGAAVLTAVLVCFFVVGVGAAGTGAVYYTDSTGTYSYCILSDDDGEYASIGKYLGSDTEVEVPRTLDGYTVKEIEFCAFGYNTKITSVTLPDTITAIAEAAFICCSDLESINFPASLTSIGDGAFQYCTALAEIEFDEDCAVSEITWTCFQGCSSLTEVVLPESVTSVYYYAFADCTSLVSITIPESVTEIAAYAFENDSSLTIYGYMSSAAETYASENSIPFVSIDECGHSYDEPVWIWAEDYSSASAVFICTLCEDVQTVEAEILAAVTEEATCTEEGSVEYYAEAVFDGKTFTDTVTVMIQALGHTYEAAVTEPTCTEEGYTTYTCSVCGYEYIDDYTQALGHTYEAAVTEPTCTEEGYTTYTCSVCGDEYIDDYTQALGHTYEAAVTEPTCTQDGYITYTCSVCGDSYIEEGDPATGHSYGNLISWNWFEDGSSCTAVFVCANDESHTQTVEADVTVTAFESSLCTEPSITVYMASVILDGTEYINTYTETTVYDSHDYEILTTIEPTATQEGLIEYICIRCGYIYSETVPAIGTTEDEIIDSQQDLSDNRIDMELDGIPMTDDTDDTQAEDDAGESSEDTDMSGETESEEELSEQTAETETETEENTAETETSSQTETETEADTSPAGSFKISASVGETVTLGSCEQDNDASDGTEDIEWYVAAKANGKALLVSVYCLDTVSFGEEGISWEDSDLKIWLETVFYEEAFTAEEAGAVSEIFILSSDETEEYLPEDIRAAAATAYAAANGAVSYAGGTCLYWTSDSAAIWRCAEVIDAVGGSEAKISFLSGVAVRVAVWAECE